MVANEVKRHNMPFNRNPNFSGRDSKLRDLETKLFIETPIHKIAIYGLGGIGKTQLALELAYRVLDKHPDYQIFWVRGQSVETFEQSYTEIATLLNAGNLIDKTTDIKKAIKQQLERDDRPKWLMILDNADDNDIWFSRNTNTNARLIDYLPRSNRGFLLFTTRNRIAAVKMAPKSQIPIEEMTGEASEELFRKLVVTEAIGDQNCLIQLLDQLAYLPLALSQAAAYINATGCSVSDYLSLLQGTESDTIKTLTEGFEDDERYNESDCTANAVATTWLISFEQIREASPLAGKYLSLMSCLAPQQIPAAILPEADSKKDYFDAVGILIAYSFIKKQTGITTEEPDSIPTVFFNMHRLVHVATRNWLKRNGSLDRFFLQATSRLDSVFADVDYRNRSQCTLMITHFHHCFSNMPQGDRLDIERSLNSVPNISKIWKKMLKDVQWEVKIFELEQYIIRNTKKC